MALFCQTAKITIYAKGHDENPIYEGPLGVFEDNPLAGHVDFLAKTAGIDFGNADLRIFVTFE
jgi:hypothetical protein